MRYKTIIIDDEPPICDEIEYLLKQEPDFDVAAKFTNALNALAYLTNNPCDLVFLDIKMPGMSGLELAQRLSALRRPPLIVFSTAFPEHALEAFATPAVGYITKPVSQTTLAHVLDKIRSLSQRPVYPEKQDVNRVCAVKNGKYIPVDPQEIVFVYVRDKEVFIRTASEELSWPLTILELERLLPSRSFLRVHRQYIVNLNKISEIVPWFHGSYLLRMNGGKPDEIPVSRNKAKELKAFMGLK